MTTTRPYLIRRRDGGTPRLIDAANPAAALRHVAQDTFTCKAATGAEVADAVRQGIILETVGEVAPPSPPPQAPAALAPSPTPATLAPIAAPDLATAAAQAIEAALDDPAAGELVQQREEDLPEPPPVDGWLRDDGSTYDTILLIDEDWTGFGLDDNANLARIGTWTDAEVQAVEAFCTAVAQLAGGDPATLPPRPAVIGGPLPGTVRDDVAPELPL